MQLDRGKWLSDGYLIAPGILPQEDVVAINRHYADVLAEHESALEAVNNAPELIHNWRVVKPEVHWEHARQTMLHPRVKSVLEVLFGGEPLAAQTIFYYKPPGTPGQGLHWDNYYFESAPSPCTAVWIALERVDEVNGGLAVVPGSHLQQWEALDEAPEAGARSRSLRGRHGVKVPHDAAFVYPELDPGDAVIFDGRLIHGSPPNKDSKRWRKSLACHYVPRSIEQISEWYLPLTDFNGAPVEKTSAESLRAKEGNAWKAVTCYGWGSEDPLDSQ